MRWSFAVPRCASPWLGHKWGIYRPTRPMTLVYICDRCNQRITVPTAVSQPTSLFPGIKDPVAHLLAIVTNASYGKHLPLQADESNVRELNMRSAYPPIPHPPSRPTLLTLLVQRFLPFYLGRKGPTS